MVKKKIPICLCALLFLSACTGGQIIESPAPTGVPESPSAPPSAPPSVLPPSVTSSAPSASDVPVFSPSRTPDTVEKDRPITLFFGGDVLLSGGMIGMIGAQEDYTNIFAAELAEISRAADLCMINLEMPFSLRGVAMEGKQYTFRADPKYVSFLDYMGADVVTLANNHTLDFGRDALADTLTTLDEAGIGRVGAGADIEEAAAPYIAEIRGKTVAVFGASRVVPSTSWYADEDKSGLFTCYDSRRLLAGIEAARESADHIIVYIHWGEELEPLPQPYQTSLAYACIDAGADVVIGSHPHVLQGLEIYKGKLIAYSLGNFVFSNSYKETAALRVELDGETVRTQAVPCWIVNLKTGLADEKQQESLRRMWEGISFGITLNEDNYVN